MLRRFKSSSAAILDKKLLRRLLTQQKAGLLRLDAKGRIVSADKRVAALAAAYSIPLLGPHPERSHALGEMVSALLEELKRGKREHRFSLAHPRGQKVLDISIVRTCDLLADKTPGHVIIFKEIRIPPLRGGNLELPHNRKLTSRQAQVLNHLVSSGLSNKHIAAELGICEGTLRKHVEAIYKTFKVNSRAELVASVNHST